MECCDCESSDNIMKWGSASRELCAECFVCSRVDAVLEVLEDRWRHADPECREVTRPLKRRLVVQRFRILTGGGKSERRDRRLVVEMTGMAEEMDARLPEHPDEQEWVESDDDDE